MKVIPGSPEADFKKISEECVSICKEYGSTDQVNVKEEPLAFGLKSLSFNFLMEESIGDTEPLEEKLRAVGERNKVESEDEISRAEVKYVREANTYFHCRNVSLESKTPAREWWPPHW